MQVIGAGEQELESATGIWCANLKHAVGSDFCFAAVSFVGATRLFSIERDKVYDVSDLSGIQTDQDTIHFGTVLANTLCQVCTQTLLAIHVHPTQNAAYSIKTWKASTRFSLASTSDGLACICLPHEACIDVMSISEVNDEPDISPIARLTLTSEPSCVTLSRLSKCKAMLAFGDHSSFLSFVRIDIKHGTFEPMISEHLRNLISLTKASEEIEKEIAPDGIALHSQSNHDGKLESYVTTRAGVFLHLCLSEERLSVKGSSKLDCSPLSLKSFENKLSDESAVLILGTTGCWVHFPSAHEQHCPECIPLLGCAGCMDVDGVITSLSPSNDLVGIEKGRLKIFSAKPQRNPLLSSEPMTVSNVSRPVQVKHLHATQRIASVWRAQSAAEVLAVHSDQIGDTKIYLPNGFETQCLCEAVTCDGIYVLVGGEVAADDERYGLISIVRLEGDDLKAHGTISVPEHVVSITSCQCVPNQSFAGHSVLFATSTSFYGCTLPIATDKQSAVRLGSSCSFVKWLRPCPCDIVVSCEDDEGICFRSLRAESFVPQSEAGDDGVTDEGEILRYSLDHGATDCRRRPSVVACEESNAAFLCAGDAHGCVACLRTDAWPEAGVSESSDGSILELGAITLDSPVCAIASLHSSAIAFLCDGTTVEIRETCKPSRSLSPLVWPHISGKFFDDSCQGLT
jgi:hypothetical protein